MRQQLRRGNGTLTELDLRLNVSGDSHYTGALGAAIFAMERMQAGAEVLA